MSSVAPRGTKGEAVGDCVDPSSGCGEIGCIRVADFFFDMSAVVALVMVSVDPLRFKGELFTVKLLPEEDTMLNFSSLARAPALLPFMGDPLVRNAAALLAVVILFVVVLDGDNGFFSGAVAFFTTAAFLDSVADAVDFMELIDGARSTVKVVLESGNGGPDDLTDFGPGTDFEFAVLTLTLDMFEAVDPLLGRAVAAREPASERALAVLNDVLASLTVDNAALEVGRPLAALDGGRRDEDPCVTTDLRMVDACDRVEIVDCTDGVVDVGLSGKIDVCVLAAAGLVRIVFPSVEVDLLLSSDALAELGDSFESGLRPSGGFRIEDGLAVLALEVKLLTDAEEDDTARVGLVMFLLTTLALKEVVSLSLSSVNFPSDGRRPVMVGGPLERPASADSRSLTGTSISARELRSLLRSSTRTGRTATDLFERPSIQTVESASLPDTYPSFAHPSQDLHPSALNLFSNMRRVGQHRDVRFGIVRSQQN